MVVMCGYVESGQELMQVLETYRTISATAFINAQVPHYIHCCSVIQVHTSRQNWSYHNWSPGPLMAATTVPPDHLWLPPLVPQTTYGCHNWSPDHLWLPQLFPRTTYGCHNWSPDHLWLPQLVPRTTYGCHNWSPRPLMVATTGPPDHLWLPQLVPPSLGGSGLGLELGLSPLTLMQTTLMQGKLFMVGDHLWCDITLLSLPPSLPPDPECCHEAIR